MNPVELDVLGAVGAAAAPAPAAAAAAPVPDAAVCAPDPVEVPADPPKASAPAEEHVVVEVVVELVDAAEPPDLAFVVVVVEDFAPPAAVVGVVVVDVPEVQGTVVAVPRAWATPPDSVPPPVVALPRYGLTRAPHDAATRDNASTASSPAALLVTPAPTTTQALTYITRAWLQPLRRPRPPCPTRSPGPIPAGPPGSLSAS